jgi:hypothetical protein
MNCHQLVTCVLLVMVVPRYVLKYMYEFYKGVGHICYSNCIAGIGKFYIPCCDIEVSFNLIVNILKQSDSNSYARTFPNSWYGQIYTLFVASYMATVPIV